MAQKFGSPMRGEARVFFLFSPSTKLFSLLSSASKTVVSEALLVSFPFSLAPVCVFVRPARILSPSGGTVSYLQARIVLRPLQRPRRPRASGQSIFVQSLPAFARPAFPLAHRGERRRSTVGTASATRRTASATGDLLFSSHRFVSIGAPCTWSSRIVEARTTVPASLRPTDRPLFRNLSTIFSSFQ